MSERGVDISFIITIFVIILIVAAIIAGMAALVVYGNKYTEHEFKLYELQDGVYGVYGTIVSNVPADNYDFITLCCDGQIRTFKGGVVISYTDTVPYAYYRDTNTVNADIVYVYVPFGSIVYQGTTGIGSR